jgi:hypothetical protein
MILAAKTEWLHDCNVATKCDHMVLVALPSQQFRLPLTPTQPSCYNMHHEIQRSVIPHFARTVRFCSLHRSQDSYYFPIQTK